MSESDVRHYLLPRLNDFWRWQDRGEVVAWEDGSTITFRAELASVLDRLAPAGLPPLSAILLLLAGFRGQERAVWDARFATIAATIPNSTLLSDVFAGLAWIRQLPEDLRSHAHAREELVDLVFEKTTVRTSPALAREIVKQLRDGLFEAWLGAWTPATDSSILPSLVMLAAGLKNVSEERLRLRLRTGLDEVPEPPPLEISPAEAIRALLQTHRGDEKIGGVVRLTKRVLAALTLPRPLADNQDLPMGGVSDISNRGPLDRLLISELAYDDLTLAVRVAVNEALYLRRETPPRARPRARSILIDHGIRTWGLPRVYATSIAMALAATSDDRGELLVLRTPENGKELEPVSLADREHVIEHLEHLAVHRHPGPFMEAFHERAQAMEAGDHVLITTADTLADQEFRPHLQAFSELPLFIISVNRDGDLELSQRSPAGTKVLRQVSLSLDDISNPAKLPPAAPHRPATSQLPASMRQEKFPLRLPVAYIPTRSMHVPALRGVVQTTSDGRLVLFDIIGQSKSLGAVQLADNLRGRSLLWGHSDGEVSWFVTGSPQQAELTLVELFHETYKTERRQLATIPKPVLGVTQHRDTLFVIHADQVAAFEMLGGEFLDVLDLPPATHWHRQRFFRGGPGNFFALAHDGTRTVLEPLRCPAAQPHHLFEVFESSVMEGPLAVACWPPRLYSFAKDSAQMFLHGDKPVEMHVKDYRSPRTMLSSDARRVVLPLLVPNTTGRVAAFIEHLPKVMIIPDDPTAQSVFLEPNQPNTVNLPTLRIYFSRIGISGNSLMLQSRRGDWLILVYNRSAQRLQLLNPGTQVPEEVQPFQDWPTPDYRSQLRVAQWESGSRAVLDARGLLHLSSPFENFPEFTLVLEEHFVSGWTQDGNYFGNPFYAGHHELLPANAALTNYLIPWVGGILP